MKSREIISQHDSPHHFEPLLPGEPARATLLERAHDLIRVATAAGKATAGPVQAQLQTLLRAMNSYYINRIEGEHTRPRDIERALAHDFARDDALARKQRLALAHMQAEAACEAAIDERIAAGEDVVPKLYSAEALKWLHQQLFGPLPAADLRLADGSTLVPGMFRQRPVAVGRHEAPAAKALPQLLARWSEVYAGARRGEAALIALAAAHHRLTWMHPLLDGNGRIALLHTRLLLHAAGLTHGLWSPLRGFARSEALPGVAASGRRAPPWRPRRPAAT